MGESAEECIEQGHEILGLRSLLRIAAASCKRDAVLSVPQDVLHVPSVHQGDDRLVAGGVLNLGAVVTQRAEHSFCRAWLARDFAHGIGGPRRTAVLRFQKVGMNRCGNFGLSHGRPTGTAETRHAGRTDIVAGSLGLPASKKPNSIGSGASP